MKKFVSAFSAVLMALALSVNAFAGAPVLFEEAGSVTNTGGEGLGLMIAAGVVGLLAIVGIVVFFVTGKKK